MLLPERLETAVVNMRTAKHVIDSRGLWQAELRRPAGKADVIEVTFEDFRPTPFALHFGVEQTDRLPLDSDAGKPLKFAAYTQGLFLACEAAAHYRCVARLPYLSPLSK